MDDVTANLNAEITTDGARQALSGIGLANKATSALDGILALPDHRNNGARREEVHQAREEGLALQVRVVSLCEILGWVDDLDRNQLVALALKAADDLTNKATAAVSFVVARLLVSRKLTAGQRQACKR